MAETKRYRLPAELGGGEVEVLWPSKNGIGYQVVLVPGGGPQFEIHENWLTEVPPPIPDEPEPGAYLIGDVLCVRFTVPEGQTTWHWQPVSLGDPVSESDSWEDVWYVVGGPDVRIVALVPKAEPAELPWRIDALNGGPTVTVHSAGCGATAAVALTLDQPGTQYALTLLVRLTDARAMAAALQTAADRAETDHA